MRHSSSSQQLRPLSTVFAALGDETRLGVLSNLAQGKPQSISRLTGDTKLSRQAVTKHLRVLQRAGVVRNIRSGRESQFELQLKPVKDIRKFLEDVTREWDRALARLKVLVEE